MPISLKLRKVLVLRSEFTKIKIPSKLATFMLEAIRKGTTNSMFQDPNISNDFYDIGLSAHAYLLSCIDNCKKRPIKANKLILVNAAEAGKKWINAFADQVEAIANDDDNRTTRQEAAANIYQANLTARKLGQNAKGKPDQPIFIGKQTGGGYARLDMKNRKGNIPTKTIFVAVEIPKEGSRAKYPNVKMIKGILVIEMFEVGQVLYQSLVGKAKVVWFEGLKRGCVYAVYAYSQFVKKQVSDLSNMVILAG